tara:strand:- start:1417 stop:1758 length:342 start_codon:yes stop_codon:yes gene_type:complete
MFCCKIEDIACPVEFLLSCETREWLRISLEVDADIKNLDLSRIPTFIRFLAENISNEVTGSLWRHCWSYLALARGPFLAPFKITSSDSKRRCKAESRSKAGGTKDLDKLGSCA